MKREKKRKEIKGGREKREISKREDRQIGGWSPKATGFEERFETELR